MRGSAVFVLGAKTLTRRIYQAHSQTGRTGLLNGPLEEHTPDTLPLVVREDCD